MNVSSSTQRQTQAAEQSGPALLRKCFRQEVMIQNYAVFTHRISALQVISVALAAQAANGAKRDVLARGITRLNKHLVDVIASAERIPYE